MAPQWSCHLSGDNTWVERVNPGLLECLLHKLFCKSLFSHPSIDTNEFFLRNLALFLLLDPMTLHSPDSLDTCKANHVKALKPMCAVRWIANDDNFVSASVTEEFDGAVRSVVMDKEAAVTAIGLLLGLLIKEFDIGDA